jgi:hypothetical protein
MSIRLNNLAIERHRHAVLNVGQQFVGTRQSKSGRERFSAGWNNAFIDNPRMSDVILLV